MDHCPQVTCKHCKQKGHTDRFCKDNQCTNCGSYGHKSAACNKIKPGTVAAKHMAIVKESLEDYKAKVAIQEESDTDSDSDEEVVSLGPSVAVDQIFADAKELAEPVIEELKVATDEEKLQALLEGSLPHRIVEACDSVPLFNPAWDGSDAPIAERFLINVPQNLQSFKAFAMCHFYVSGYSNLTLKNALAKVPLWLVRQGISDKDLTPEIVEQATQIVWAVFKSRAQVSTLWERIKLMVYDWWQEFLERPSTWFATSMILGAVGAGLTYKFGSIHSTLIMTGFTAATWLIQWMVRRYIAYKTTIVEEECPTLPDFCTEMQEIDTEIAADATVQVCRSDSCKQVEFQVGFTICPGAIWIPRLCWHNELNALAYRQLLPAIGTPDRRKELWTQGEAALTLLLPPVEVPPAALSPEALELFLQKYPKNRRSQIRNAYELINNTFVLRSCVTKAFVKREWLVGKRLEKRNPRLISGKTDEYLAETGPEYYFWMKAMCKEYWHTVDLALQQRFIYTGGMTGDQIGAVFTHFVLNRGWEVIEGDYSRYDGHNEVEALDAEMAYYSKSMSPETLTALRRQLHTTGRTSSGHKFSCKGKVASGVINTSFGNTIRGFMIVAAYTTHKGIEDFAVMQLGDDNVIFVADIDEFDLSGFVEFAEGMGHKLGAEWRKDPDFAEYCSQRFWNVGDRYVLGPKPARVLAKTFVCHDPSLTDVDMPGYCQQIAIGFQHYSWIPLLGPLVVNMANNGAKVSNRVKALIKRNAQSQYHKVNLRTEIDVDTGSVVSQFIKIYGFDPRPLDEEIRTFPIKYGYAWHNEMLYSAAVTDGVVDAQTNYWGSIVFARFR